MLTIVEIQYKVYKSYRFAKCWVLPHLIVKLYVIVTENLHFIICFKNMQHLGSSWACPPQLSQF